MISHSVSLDFLNVSKQQYRIVGPFNFLTLVLLSIALYLKELKVSSKGRTVTPIREQRCGKSWDFF